MYQDNVENQGRASEATIVRFLWQDNVLQNLSIDKDCQNQKKKLNYGSQYINY